MKYRVLLLCTFLIVAATLAGAQVSSAQRHGFPTPQSDDSMPTNSISGSLQTMDGHPVANARVELQEASGTRRAATYTLPNGTFEFRSVPRGHYEVVAIQGVRQVRQDVTVDNFMTQVSLRTGPAQGNDASPNSVSVAEMKVPDKAREAMRKAEEAFHKQKVQQARKETDKALKIAPTYARALTMEGVLDLNENKLNQAEDELQAAIRADPRYGMAYVVMGAVYNVRSRFDDALRSLNTGISMVPNSWQAYFELAKALLGKGDYRQSLQNVDRATQFAPMPYPPLHLLRANALLGLKDSAHAVSELEEYLAREPNGLDSANARRTLDKVRAYMASNRN